MSLRESLQAIYASPERQVAEAEVDWRYGWPARSRLSPFRKLAKTVRQHWDGILAYFDTRLTSAGDLAARSGHPGHPYRSRLCFVPLPERL